MNAILIKGPPVDIKLLSDFPADINTKGTAIIMPATSEKIIIFMIIMTRKDQKFAAAPEKNTEAFFSITESLRIVNKPPVMKAFKKKLKMIIRKNPVVSAENIFKNGLSRSVITSAFIESCINSVTMLLPSILLKPDLTGSETRLIRINRTSQLIMMPFHDLRDDKAPVFRLYNIFIFSRFKVILC